MWPVSKSYSSKGLVVPNYSIKTNKLYINKYINTNAIININSIIRYTNCMIGNGKTKYHMINFYS